MPSRVLYHCPCSTGSSPCLGPTLASSSCHALASLYFCEECDSIRCNLCTNNEVAIYYCPSCLFEVPVAGIKGEKSRCSRNCFLCPVCTNTLSVSPSDVGGAKSHALQQQLDGQKGMAEQDDWNPRSAQASVGEAPYYLICTTCKWDSKEIGMVFEKSTGLSLQVQRHEETAMDVVEFNQLRSHFEAYLKMTNDHQPTASSSSTLARSSKLLRDVPSLANDPLFSFQKRSSRPKAESRQELDPYEALSAWDAGRDRQKYVGSRQGLEEGRALGMVGRREQNRIDFLCEQAEEREVSGLAQRWESPADQSVCINDIGPTRVPLKTKQTKRCSVCRHIIVKSEPKAQSSRYKIKLMALNYLPEIQIRLPATAGMAAGVSTTEERRRSSTLLASRRREASTKADEENLHPGRSYLFEASFLNPLDDAMTVRLHIAKHTGTSPADGQEAKEEAAVSSPSKRESPRSGWRVTPTTSSFPIGAFNEVWELDEEDNELLESVAKGSLARTKDEGSRGGEVDDVDEMLDDFDEEMDDDREHKRSRTDLGGKRERRRKGDGILKRKGHETTIGLELALGKEAAGEIEFAMQVTYHYSPDGGEEQQQRSKKDDNTAKSFSFWTVIRLGQTTSETNRSSISGLPATSTEARRSALDKRRSIMGINVTAPSTLASLRESNEVKVPRDLGNLAGFDEE